MTHGHAAWRPGHAAWTCGMNKRHKNSFPLSYKVGLLGLSMSDPEPYSLSSAAEDVAFLFANLQIFCWSANFADQRKLDIGLPQSIYIPLIHKFFISPLTCGLTISGTYKRRDHLVWLSFPCYGYGATVLVALFSRPVLAVLFLRSCSAYPVVAVCFCFVFTRNSSLAEFREIRHYTEKLCERTKRLSWTPCRYPLNFLPQFSSSVIKDTLKHA